MSYELAINSTILIASEINFNKRSNFDNYLSNYKDFDNFTFKEHLTTPDYYSLRLNIKDSTGLQLDITNTEVVKSEQSPDFVKNAQEYTNKQKNILHANYEYKAIIKDQQGYNTYSSVYIPEKYFYCSNSIIKDLGNGWFSKKESSSSSVYFVATKSELTSIEDKYVTDKSKTYKPVGTIIAKDYKICFENVYLVDKSLSNFEGNINIYDNRLYFDTPAKNSFQHIIIKSCVKKIIENYTCYLQSGTHNEDDTINFLQKAIFPQSVNSKIETNVFDTPPLEDNIDLQSQQPNDNPLISFGNGFLDFYKSIPSTLSAPFQFFSNNEKKTPLSILSNGSAVLSTVAGGISAVSFATAGAMALTGIGLPISAALVGVGTISGGISGASGIISLGSSLLQDNNGELTTNPNKDIPNKLKQTVCGQKGGQLNDNDIYEITNGWYCAGNVTALVGSIAITNKAIKYTKSSLNKLPICLTTRIDNDLPLHEYAIRLLTINASALACIKLKPNSEYLTNTDFDYKMLTDSKGRIYK